MKKSENKRKAAREQRSIIISCAGGGFAAEIEALLSAFESTDRFVFALPRIEARHLIRRFGSKHFFVTANVSHSRKRGLKRSPYFWFSAVIRCAKKTRLYKPIVVVVIGSVDGLPILIACKFLGIKSVFVESITRVDSLSRTGKIVYYLRLCDYFLVQWPSLAQSYARATYKGAVYDLRHGRVDVF